MKPIRLYSLVLFIAVSFLSVELSAQARFYPAARSGGNYMHNFYFPPSPSATPWAPDWSPDGEWIAVAMQGSIWKVDPDTGGAYELTYNDAYHSSPDWSPDGEWIIYTADYAHQRIQLEILNLETHSRSNTSHLDGAHTCFGKVIEGVDTVDDIREGDSILDIEIID